MARPIDEKIVAMKMDNSDFKRKAVETTSLFGKLTQALNKIPGINIGKVSNDLNGIKRAANGVDLSPLGRSIDTIASRFSNLGLVATTALVNISNKAVDAGLALIDSLGMSQMREGFREYELKMGSITTILANTARHGTTLDDVKKSFEELNAYADRTIYSFADMTRNIGLFTNAGLKLEESTSMIKGFSNAAAASGTNATDAARAAYQLSQGLSQGYIMQMDWMSLTNAGMGNDNMKRDLIAIGKAMGTVSGETETLVKNWKENLSDKKWLTTDVMSTYLQAMAGDIDKATLKTIGLTDAQADMLIQNAKIGQDAAITVRTFTQMMDTLKEGIGSGWSESWEIIFGDFEEATKLWTGLSKFFDGFFQKQAESRNKLLRGIFDGGTLGMIFSGLKNATTPLIQVFEAIGKGFRKAFPPVNVGSVRSLIEAFKNLTSKMKLSEKTVTNIQTIFSGFFSIFVLAGKAISGLISAIIGLLPSFSGLGSKLVELVSKVAKIPLNLNKATDSTEAFGSILNGLKKIATGVATGLEFIVGGLILLVDAISASWSLISRGDFSGGPWEEDSKIVDKLLSIRETVVDVVSAIKETWGILTKGVFTGGGPWDKDSTVVNWLFNIRDGFKLLGETLSAINVDTVTASFTNFFNAIKTGFIWVKDVFVGIGQAIKNAMPEGNTLLAGGFMAAMVTIVGFVLKAMWDIKNVFSGWSKIGHGVTEVLEGVGGALESFSLQVKSQALLKIAIAVGVLAASFWVLSTIESNKIVSGLYAIVGSLSALVLAMAIMTKYEIDGGGLKAAVQIVALSIAFSIIAISLKSLSDLDWDQINKGLYGLIGVMGLFSAAMVVMSKYGGDNLAGSTLQFVAIAGSVWILVKVLKEISDMKPESLKQGMLGLGGVLILFIGSLTLMSRYSKGSIASSAIQFTAIALSILTLVGALKLIASIDVDALKTGLLTITIILALVTLFAKSNSDTDLLKTGAGLGLLAIAMNLLIAPIAAIGAMKFSSIIKGIYAIAILLAIFAGFSWLMKDLVIASSGLLVLAIALNLLITPIAILGSMSLKNLAIGIGALAVGLLAIGGAAALLGLAAGPLLLGAAGILVLGIALLAAGAGISLFSTGLVMLAAMTGTAVVTIVSMLGTLITGLVSLIPVAVEFIVKIVHGMADAFQENAPVLASKLASTLLALMGVIEKYVPKFVTAWGNIIVSFLDSMGTQIPRIIDSFTTMILNIIEAMAEAVAVKGPQITAAFMLLMAEISIVMVNAGIIFINALFGWIPGVQEATNQIGIAAESSIRDAFDAAGTGTDKGKEFATSLEGEVATANAAGSKVAKSAEAGADSVNFSKVGSGHGSDMASGLNGKTGSLGIAGKNIAVAGERGADSANFETIGSGHGTDFSTGIVSKVSAATTSGTGLATSGKEGASSISLTSTGENFGLGFSGGIGKAYDSAVQAGKALARKAKEAVSNWLVIRSPSRIMTKDGVFFGQGLANGIAKSSKIVSSKAKDLAMTARESLNRFIQGFEIPVEDNEIHFRAVIDYDPLDPNGFGSVGVIGPDTSFTNRLISSVNSERRSRLDERGDVKSDNIQNGDKTPTKTPAVIQVVTPEKRELARWLVDDITDFQDFKLARNAQF